jgi:hypothetical protein
MVVNHLQLFDEWCYYLVKGEVLYFPPGINNSIGTNDCISLMRENLEKIWLEGTRIGPQQAPQLL